MNSNMKPGGQTSGKPTPKVAVIILNWNGEKLLREFLPSVIRHTPKSVGRVIVADNGSTDGSIALLQKEFQDVELLIFPENYGFAEGYNRAIAHYADSYPYSVLLNSDVAVDSDWLTPLYRYMESHPETGACQPKILSYRERGKFEYAGASGGFIDRYGYPYCRGRIFSTLEEDKGQYDSEMEIDWATGAALMVCNRVYLETGGLDREFFAHMEEIDLCWRIRLAGWKIAVVPKSHVYHLGGGSLDALNPRKTYLNFRNNLLMLHKNLPEEDRGRLLFRRRLLDTLAWAKFMATLKFGHANAILRAHRDFRRMRRNYSCHPRENLLRGKLNILTSYYLRGRKRFCEL